MTQTAILGAGVMGETLLSGLVRAGRRVDDLLVGEKRPERARELEERYGVAVVGNVEAAAQGRHPRARRQAAGHGRPARRDRPALRAGPAGRLARRRHHHRVHRVAAARRRRRRPGHAQHPGPGRRGHGRDLARARTATRSTSPRPRRCCASVGKVVRVPEKQQDAVTAISGSGPAYIFFVVEAMIEAGVHLGPAARHRHRARRPDPRRLGQDAARDRRAPDRAARAGHLPRRHHRRRAAPARDHKVRAAFLTAMEAAAARSAQLASGLD